MKKKFIISTLLVIVTLSLSVAGAKVILNDSEIKFSKADGKPYKSSSTYMLPLYAVAEAYGAEVSVDKETGTALVTKDATTLALNTAESIIYRNSTKIPVPSPLVWKNNAFFAPAEFLSALDAVMYINGDVVIATAPSYSSIVSQIRYSGNENDNYWNIWTDARNKKAGGDYNGCINVLNSFAPSVLKDGNTVNSAIIFSEFGECYGALGAKADASACYKEAARIYSAIGMPEDAKVCTNKADALSSTVQIFAASYDENYRGSKYFGELYEPKNGIFLGATLKNSDAANMEYFPKTLGFSMAGYLIYADLFDEPYEKYKSVFAEAKQRNIIVQYALQPRDIKDLTSIKSDDERYVKLATELNSTGCKIFLRFASEMNDPSNAWYTKDASKFIKSFQKVVDIFRKYAPNVAIVWSPNFYPAETMADYYPGDKYVDYVGISAYCEHQPADDGVDRSRFASLLDKIVSLYGHKKPIIISESGASYTDPRTGADITAFSSRQIADFYTYLPIKYPQVKAAFIFETVDARGGRQFQFYANDRYFNAYRSSVLGNVSYLQEPVENPVYPLPYYFELGNGVAVPPAKINIYSYVKTFENDVSYVAYHINGNHINTSEYIGTIPYGTTVDFSPYAGQTISFELRAFNNYGTCASKTYSVYVSPYQSYDNALGDNIHTPQGGADIGAMSNAFGLVQGFNIPRVFYIAAGILIVLSIIVKFIRS